QAPLKDKIPPHNIEAEKATLGAILINPEAKDTVVMYLRPDDFYKNSHKTIFKAILDLSEKGENIDILTVVQQLRNIGRLDDCGGASYVSSLSSEVPSSANVEYYSKIVQENSIRRGLIKISGEIALRAFDDTTETASVLEKTEKLIFEIIEKRSTSKYKSIKELLPDAMEAIQKLINSKDSCTGIPSGFKDLDKKTNGFQKSEFIVIGARPSVGKTALALTMAANIAIRHKIPVGFFSLEMSEQAIMQRLISSEARVDSEHIRSGLVSEIHLSKIHDAAGDIYEAPLYLTSVSDLKILDLRALSRKLIRDHGVKIIFVDYLTMIQAENKTIPRHEQIAEISRSLKTLARELDIPIVVLSQVKREAEKKEPTLADLRESGSIEQDADLVIFLHREKTGDDTKPDNTGAIETAVIIAKQRNGPIGDIKMVFIPKYTRFESSDKSEN
ncbi:MAG: replicative DNA helicase, partial [Spirochaetaceae bacterium]|nr:replicative DNA helicase [Spirochaetaceae bacterium]